MKSKYIKPFRTIQEQIELLKKRGLTIDDEEKAARYLRNISYYHLAIYIKPFQNKPDVIDKGVTFEDVLNLYVFDKNLRLLLLDILERIEMSLKHNLIYEITKKTTDTIWYTKEDSFSFSSEDKEQNNENFNIFKGFLERIKENNNKEAYIQYYYENFNEPLYPPSWMFFESLSLGESVKFLGILSDQNQTFIAKKYALPYKTNRKWLKSLTHLRNICAHHARLWNRNFIFRVSGKSTKYEDVLLDIQKNSLFAYLIVLQIYLKKINPTSHWLDRLEKLINKHEIEVNNMGFPENWKEILNTL